MTREETWITFAAASLGSRDTACTHEQDALAAANAADALLAEFDKRFRPTYAADPAPAADVPREPEPCFCGSSEELGPCPSHGSRR